MIYQLTTLFFGGCIFSIACFGIALLLSAIFGIPLVFVWWQTVSIIIYGMAVTEAQIRHIWHDPQDYVVVVLIAAVGIVYIATSLPMVRLPILTAGALGLASGIEILISDASW